MNSGFYFVPVLVKTEYETFCESLRSEWEKIEWESVRYFLPYSAAVFSDDKLSKTFVFTGKLSSDLFLCTDLLELDGRIGGSVGPELYKIQLTVFSTGIAFLYYQIDYHEMPLDLIEDFAFRFKRAVWEKDKLGKNTIHLFDATKELLPKDLCVLFFTANNDIKMRCLVYQCVYFPQLSYESCRNNALLLRRGYHSNFETASESEVSDYDTLYSPYSYMTWGGSDEGLCCVCCEPDNERGKKFLNCYLPSQLSNDYLEMYLLLINQKFSMIHYVTELSKDTDNSNFEHLSEMATTMKLKFSFRVISDDMIYQNVYSKMYQLMQLDALMSDIEEGKDRTQSIVEKKEEKHNKIRDGVLIVISFLTIFSVLIDASSYFDRLMIVPNVSTLISLFLSIIAIIVIVVMFMK